MIFPVFHVSQLKKYLRVPEERVEVKDMKIGSDLVYQEHPSKFWTLRTKLPKIVLSRCIKFRGVTTMSVTQPRRQMPIREKFTLTFTKNS
jgi:hypothetical protein